MGERTLIGEFHADHAKVVKALAWPLWWTWLQKTPGLRPTPSRPPKP